MVCICSLLSYIKEDNSSGKEILDKKKVLFLNLCYCVSLIICTSTVLFTFEFLCRQTSYSPYGYKDCYDD